MDVEVSGVHTVRYRPGQRHALRVDLSDGFRAGTPCGRIDRDKSGARAVLDAACPGAGLCVAEVQRR